MHVSATLTDLAWPKANQLRVASLRASTVRPLTRSLGYMSHNKNKGWTLIWNLRNKPIWTWNSLSNWFVQSKTQDWSNTYQLLMRSDLKNVAENSDGLYCTSSNSTDVLYNVYHVVSLIHVGSQIFVSLYFAHFFSNLQA